MTAPASLASRILLRLAGHHAQKPARAAEVLELVGGPEEEFYAALDELAATCQINSATVKRFDDAAPWRAIWPTGVIRPMPLTGNRLGGLFVKHKPQRQVVREVSGPKLRAEPAPARASAAPVRAPVVVVMPAAPPAPATKPEPAAAPKRHKQVGRPRELTKAHLVNLITGLTRENAIRKRDLALAVGATGVNPLAIYGVHINEVLAEQAWIGSVTYKSAGGPGVALYDTRTDPSSGAPCFLLEDGALEIETVRGRLRLSPADTLRLRAVLAEARP